MLWKQRFTIVAVWIILSAVAVAIVFALPAQYTSEALILVESQKIPEALVASTANGEVQDRLATIKQQVLSSTRLQKVIDKFSLYASDKGKNSREEIVDRMRKDIKITLEKGWSRNQPGAFRVSYTGTNPTKVAPVANELTNLFIEANYLSRENQAFGTSDFLKSQLEQAKKNLEQQEAKVSAYKLAHNGDLPEQEGVLHSKLDQYNMEMQANREAINRLEQTKNVLEGEIASAEAYRAAILSGAMETNAPANATSANAPGAVGKQQEERGSQKLRRQLGELRLRYTADYPAVRELQAQLAETLRQEEQQDKEQQKLEEAQRAQEQARLAEQKAHAGAGPGVSPRTKPEIAQLLMREQERINVLKTQLSNANQEEENHRNDQDALQKQISEYQARIEQLPIRQQEMTGLLRDYDISTGNYRSLLNKDFSADMASEMEKREKSERFALLDPARPPEKPSKPNRLLLNAVGILASLLVGLVFGYGIEWKKNLLLGEWELPAGTVVLGRVPLIPNPPFDSKSSRSSKGAAPLRLKLRIRWVYPFLFSLTLLFLIGLWLKKG